MCVFAAESLQSTWSTGARHIDPLSAISTIKGCSRMGSPFAVAPAIFRLHKLKIRRKSIVFHGRKSEQTLCTSAYPAREGSRVYSADGLSITLTSQAGGFGGKTGLYEIIGLPDKVKN